MRTLSAEVIHPLQAKQSFKEMVTGSDEIEFESFMSMDTESSEGKVSFFDGTGFIQACEGEMKSFKSPKKGDDIQ